MLFADLKSSLERLADRDPEEARQLLDPMIEAMMEAVHRYEGTVNQVLGDGIMANRIRERWGMAGLVSVGARLWLSASLSGVGEFAEALGRAREAVKLAEAANHPWSLGGARMALGSTLVSRGHLAEAVPVLEQGIAFSREMGITAWLPMLFSALGAARARGGHADEGVALLEEGVARARALSIVSRQSLRLTWLAEAYLLAGRLDDARATVQEAHRLAREHKEKAYEGWALRMSGELNADPAAAAELYRRALARADELYMRPLAALCHLGLASLSRRTGNTARGADHLSVALGLLRELDMRYWLERATTEPPVLG